jgi:hypothetical protein|tara:strand:+ start:2192 stop:3226 length:1035 start_codon:yes stop_codon:yes gene_type:complete
MALTAAESKILYSIRVGSENNPEKPEFPPEDPKFPASSTFRINVPGFSNVWLKDESTNPTGTHKDRMAWEMVVTYRDFLISKKNGQLKNLPQMSIITAGSAAFAIQTLLRKYKLPNLKCLVDIDLDERIIKCLEKIGCEIFRIDLSRKPFHWKEILTLTNNLEGLDITSNDVLGPTIRYYDWLSYEILNQSPDYCFLPFGSGNLYENLLNITKNEVLKDTRDPRFSGDIQTLKNCNFIGATVSDPKSKADKLYSPHLPFVHFDEQWIRIQIYSGTCGQESGVFILNEKNLDEAIKIANNNDIKFEPSGICGLGMLLQMKNKVPKDAKILIVNTGKTKWPTDFTQ